MTREDQWFAALDGYALHVGATTYLLVVDGVHCEDAGDLWIQLAAFHEEDRGLVLHCVGPVTPSDVIRELRKYLASRSRSGGVLSVSASVPADVG